MPSSKKKFSSEEVEGWTTEEVIQWLASVKLEAFREEFEMQEMTGMALLQITGDEVKAMDCTEKRKKAMKKALVSLPGNSVSSKAKPKKPRKHSASKNPGPPLPPPLPQSAPPGVPPGSSRPSVARGHLPPSPAPGGEEYYEDPILSSGNQQGTPPVPWREGGEEMIPEEEDYGEEPTDIYDCVDEMDLPVNEDKPHPPPHPPQDNGFNHAPPPPSYPPGYEDQDIYDNEEPPLVDQDSFSDSFSSEADSGEDDYLSPFEEDPSSIPEELLEARDRGESNAIRTLKGRFFAHGLTKHTGINLSSPSPKGTPRDIPQPPAEEEEEEFEDEIYDIVPDELKEFVQQASEMEGEEPDDIYDVPGDMIEPPPLILPPKPKAQKPSLPEQVAPSPSSVPPPYGYGEDNIYEGDEVDDVYDVPSEVEQQEMNRAGKPPPPPPPPSSPPAEVMSPFDEDIYDTADLELEVESSPPLPSRPTVVQSSPPLPTRPPKSNDLSSAPLISRFNKPLSSPSVSPAMPRSPFNDRPAMKKPPSPRSPPVSPVVALPPRPPKSESSKPLPPPLPAEPRTPPLPPPPEPHPPPLPPPAEPHPLPPPANGTSSFQCPPLRAPINDLAVGPPPPRPPNEKKPGIRNKQETMEQRLAKLSPASKRVPSPHSSSPPMGPDHSPKMSPKFGRKPVEKTANKDFPAPPPIPSSAASELKSSTSKPPIGKTLGNKGAPGNKNVSEAPCNVTKPSVNETSKPFPGQKLTSASVNKSGTKASRISNLMNKFENKAPEAEGSSGGSSGPSPFTSPIHKLDVPSKPEADVSPLSGRRMVRKESVDDLTNKFGGRTRSPSPDIKPPSLPPKAPGIVVSKLGNVGSPSSAKKAADMQSNESLAAKPSWGKKPPEEPKPPWTKKPAGKQSDNSPPAKPSWKKKAPDKPADEPPHAKPWTKKQLGKPADKDELPSAKPWTKKPLGKPADNDEPPSAKPWTKKQLGKPSEDGQPSTSPPWVKKQLGKPSGEESPKPWTQKQHNKPPGDEPSNVPPPAKKQHNKPPGDEPPNVPPPAKPWMKKPLTKPQDDQDEPPSLPPPLKPSLNKSGKKSKPPEPAGNSSPEEIEEEPPPPRPPPSSAFPKVPEASSSPSIGKRVAPSPGIMWDKPTEEKSPGAPKRVFTYKPFNPREHSSASASATLPRNQSPTPEEPITPRLPEKIPGEPPGLPDRNPPPSYKAPPEPDENSPPGLLGRNPPPPIRVPPIENVPPNFSSRLLPPTQRAPAEPQSGPPSLPSRNPPSHRPSDPPLPPRPGQPVSPNPATAMPALPERSWKPPPQQLPELPSPRLPPDLPTSRPPDIPSMRAPVEPFPAGDPPHPSRNVPPGSPIGQMWYHANLDRKRAEAMLKRYSKDGTFIIRDSARVAGEYSLSLWYGGGVRHLRIRTRADKKFVLGEEKSDECAFETVMGLVAHHRRGAIKLKSGGETTLKYECPK